MASGYFQVELHPDDREISAFSTPTGHYEFKRMAMGLRNAPSTWQRLMYSVFSGLVGLECLVYLDDVIVFSSSNYKEHLERLKSVFDRLRQANLKLKPTKCNFLMREAKYLGHIISSEGVKTDPEKTKIVESYPVPKNPKGVRAFLGLCGFYRRFIPNFATIVKPLIQLTKKDIKYHWGKEQETAFKTLKQALVTPPILKYPDFRRPFIVATDASGIAISAILSQKYEIEHPICYASRCLKDPETRYSTIEREALAIVWAVKYFRCYLVGTKFIIITDHRPLKYLLTIKEPSSRLARWAMTLAEFDFEVQYRPGKHHHVDAFTRLDYLEETENEVRVLQTECTPIIYELEEIQKAQEEDEEVLTLQQKEGFYKAPNGLSYKERNREERQDKLIVPKKMQRKIIQLYHDTPFMAHGGRKKTTELIQKEFYWKGMTQDIRKYCEGCHSCNIRKTHPHPSAEMQTMPVPPCTFGLVSMDIVGPLNLTTNGNKYILTCMDYLTRYPECIALPDMKTETIARAFVNNVILRHGTPRILLTDCGAQFLSDVFTEICQKLNIEKIQTSPYRPSTNGVIERMHHVLKTMISHYVTEENSNWDEMLPYVLMAYRNRTHEATNESPFFLMYGRDMELPFHSILKPDRVRYNIDIHYPTELMARLNKALQQASKTLEDTNIKRGERANQKRKFREFQIGDRVYLYTPAIKGNKLASKFYPKWSGPYRIVTQTGPVNFKIKEIGTTKELLVHTDRLKLWKSNDKEQQDDQEVKEASPANAEEQQEHEIDGQLTEPPEVPEHQNINLWYPGRNIDNNDTSEESEQDSGEESSDTLTPEWDDHYDYPQMNEWTESSSEEEQEEANQEPEQELQHQQRRYNTRSQGRASPHPWVLRRAL
ncbi:Transposon Tf2-6 polyprotein-like Protein [Tribolium castaneum]|uniref:RNA-directed DNA polymerase n=1 Tax=Tribolium castaneum TaxID=7070 RepID=D6WH09_TRICA|nr:Transposon Tf2-6 polyprotein-like Protein [Tribolium castaneum]